MSLDKALVQQIREVQKEHGFNDAQMSIIVGMSRSHFNEAMHGKRSFTKQAMIKLRKVFRVDLNKAIDLLEND